MRPGPAPAEVTALLAPYSDHLLPGTLEGYALPQSDGSLRNRKNIRRAMTLLQEAGFAPDADGILRSSDGGAVEFTLLLPKGNTENKAIADLYQQALQRLGIAMQIETIDDAQYTARTNEFDFDMTTYRRALSLSPGNEQRFYWGSDAAAQAGSRNLMGVQSPAIDAMIDAMLAAPSQDAFTQATRALDRVLTAGRYVVPFWQYTTGRIAHDRSLKFPATTPIYGDGPNFMPEIWWVDESQ
jgi:peptide/nickel transport system substrate-binding protein